MCFLVTFMLLIEEIGVCSSEPDIIESSKWAPEPKNGQNLYFGPDFGTILKKVPFSGPKTGKI